MALSEGEKDVEKATENMKIARSLLTLNDRFHSVFESYVNNEIPAHFIDTLNMRIVSRKDLAHVFQDEIADVTQEYILERVSNYVRTFPPGGTRPADPHLDVIWEIVKEIVKYDVLSHRWDEVTGEPTYQDISDREQSIAKYVKLAKFCQTSRSLGRRLAWADTCCIDKTNSAELSEAIHAMYKWYANSHLCIAHLAESMSYEDWDGDPWFTRGWTLQEFLSPQRLRFYGREWQPLTHSTLDDDRKLDHIIPHLEKVTGISKKVFTANNKWGVRGCSFWEIMSWASKRQTTRVEDMAYCLIGLFRVSLPIAYGEGERAFVRLIEALAARGPSWHILAWFGRPSEDHFALPLSPASYPRFEADMADRIGVRELTLTAHELSLKSLPLIPLRLRSFALSEEPEKQYLVNLKQQGSSKLSLGTFGDLIVECGVSRLQTIQNAQQIAACIINHDGPWDRERGRLFMGREYLCLLLYTPEGEAGTWRRLTTDNSLRISCLRTVGAASTVGSIVRFLVHFKCKRPDPAGPGDFTLPLVTTIISSPRH